MWARFNPAACDDRVTVLKETQKSAVYRLARSGVIAKRCRSETARIERAVYENVLSRAPLPRLRCYGFAADDDDPGYAWLFLEDSAGREWRVERHWETAAISRWLALLHSSCLHSCSADLPVFDTGYYRRQLHEARGAADRLRSAADVPDQDRMLLESIVEQCDQIECRWDVLAQLCSAMPSALVHGDIKRKNVHFRDESVFVIDWECAGWGPVAPDLARIDPAAYAAVWKNAGSDVGLRLLQRWSGAGLLFRSIQSIVWATPFALYGQTDKAFRRMRGCPADMQSALRLLE
jgi:Ser/Thr protein kinase RdoA (MazF antagonist)